MKKYLSGFLTGIIITLTITTFASTVIKEAYFNNDIKIIDSEKGQVNTEIVTVIKDGETSGRNFVSVADLSKALDKQVLWDGSTKTIKLSNMEVKTMTTTGNKIPVNEIQNAYYTTYNGMEAIEYNNNIYVSRSDLNSKYDLWWEGSNNIFTVYKKSNPEKTIIIDLSDINQVLSKLNVKISRIYVNKTLVKELTGE